MASARVVVVCGDRAGRVMAGPAIRAVELARGLGRAGHPVVLAVPEGSDATIEGLAVASWSSPGELRAAVAEAEVVVVFAAVLAEHLWLADLEVPLVVDAYDPALFETLEARRGEPVNAQRDWAADAARHQLEPLAVADVVLVASDRQRHFVLGALAAVGRVGPRTVAEDPTLEQLVRIVPFGLPDEPPSAGPSPLRGPDGPFGADDFVALWGGGLYPWLDPLTLVDALARVDDERVVAAFLAGPHPTPAVGRMPLVDEARQRAGDLGLGRRVHFVETWVPYDQRGLWLSGSDIGVSLHHPHVETELSFRTRVLDYLWAGLPIVCTAGDVVAELVAAEDLGIVVPAGDVEAVADALATLADASPQKRASRRRRLADAARRRHWDAAIAPLVDACAEPRLAPDRRVAENLPHRRGDGLRRAMRVAQGLPGALVASNGLRTEGKQ
jgi:glycosyltransferase involved in cell wall biosynthesis